MPRHNSRFDAVPQLLDLFGELADATLQQFVLVHVLHGLLEFTLELVAFGELVQMSQLLDAMLEMEQLTLDDLQFGLFEVGVLRGLPERLGCGGKRSEKGQIISFV